MAGLSVVLIAELRASLDTEAALRVVSGALSPAKVGSRRLTEPVAGLRTAGLRASFGPNNG